MTSKIDTLREVFAANDQTQLIEPKEGMKRILSTINNTLVTDYLLVNLDTGTDIYPFLKGDENEHGLQGLKRKCDYIIFVEDDRCDLYAFLVELKKGKDSPKEQLKMTVPLVRFIEDRLRLIDMDLGHVLIYKVGLSDVVVKEFTHYKGKIEFDDDQYVKLYKNKTLDLRKLMQAATGRN